MNRILGNWALDPSDAKAKQAFGDIGLTFNKDGTATYLINTDDNKQQAILLTYKIEGDKLITDQPTHPKKETSKFLFNKDGTLTIFFENQEARFIRGSLAD